MLICCKYFPALDLTSGDPYPSLQQKFKKEKIAKKKMLLICIIKMGRWGGGDPPPSLPSKAAMSNIGRKEGKEIRVGKLEKKHGQMN